jgi:hypothetical protein
MLRETLIAERYDFLTEDPAGIGLITESLYGDEPGLPLDEALFALFSAWLKHGHGPDADETRKAMNELCFLLDEKASRMAAEWADQEIERMAEEGGGDPDPEGIFDRATLRAIEARGVTGYASL